MHPQIHGCAAGAAARAAAGAAAGAAASATPVCIYYVSLAGTQDERWLKNQDQDRDQVTFP